MTKDNDLGAQSATAVEAAGSIASDAASHVAPVRVQRKRSKGWKMPANTVYVGRPTRWGNPFEVSEGVTRSQAVNRYLLHLGSYFGWVEQEIRLAFYPWPVVSTELRDWLRPLRGKNLACWCPLDQPCHADVLLEIANATQPVSEASGSVPSAVQE